MADKIDEIVDMILGEMEHKTGVRKTDKVYSDQPLFKRASDLKSPEIPQKIKDMKGLAYDSESMRERSYVRLFRRQGEFMKDFTDDYPYTKNFQDIFPTYSSLNNEQLRGYFTWRTCYRKGEIAPAPLPFIMMYAFELINNIGIESHENGFERLRKLYCDFWEIEKNVSLFIPAWLIDYAVYYRLDPKSIELSFDNDATIIKMKNYDKVPNDELFETMCLLSFHDTTKSEVFTQHEDVFKETAVRAYRKLAEYFSQKRSQSLFEHYFGKTSLLPVRLFENAVFDYIPPKNDYEYEINEVRSYIYKNGYWSCKCYHAKIINGKNKSIDEFLKAVENIILENLCGTSVSHDPKIKKFVLKIISDELSAVLEEKKRREKMNVKIDVSRLSSIRADADIVRDFLLTEEDMYDEINESPAEEKINKIPKNEPTETNSDSPLDENEKTFLNALLTDGSYSEAARKIGILPSVLADSINEKLFDIFGDTVIDFSSDIPELIEDYTDELKDYI